MQASALTLPGHVFLTLISISSIHEHRNELRQEKRVLAKLRRKLAFSIQQELNRPPTPVQHLQELPQVVKAYRKQADRYRTRYIIIQIITILLSAAITSISGGWLDRYFSIPWLIPVCSGLISILTSFTLFFKFREKGANLQQTADAMDLEYKACCLRIGDYKGVKDQAEALVLLAERTEAPPTPNTPNTNTQHKSSQVEQKSSQAGA